MDYFILGLIPAIRDTVRTQQPKTIEEAIKLILSEVKGKKRKGESLNTMTGSEGPSSTKQAKEALVRLNSNVNSNEAIVALIDFVKDNEKKWNDKFVQLSKNFRSQQAHNGRKLNGLYQRDVVSYARSNNIARDKNSGQDRRKVRRCFNCGSEDHLAAKCTQNKSNKQYGNFSR